MATLLNSPCVRNSGSLFTESECPDYVDEMPAFLHPFNDLDKFDEIGISMYNAEERQFDEERKIKNRKKKPSVEVLT